MLEKLTNEQEKLMAIVRDEWLNRFFSGHGIDKKKATRGIEWLYEFSGLKNPQIVFVDSPLAAQMAAMVSAVKRPVFFMLPYSPSLLVVSSEV